MDCCNRYNNATECSGCEAGMVTKNENSKDKNSCLDPPGYGYYKEGPPSQRVKACPNGFYKEGEQQYQGSLRF